MSTALISASGALARGLPCHLIHEANVAGRNPRRRVIMYQTTGRERADELTRRGCRYPVVVLGIANGRPVNRVDEVSCVEQSLAAADSWGAIVEHACDPATDLLLSNKGEWGWQLSDADTPDANPPQSYPAQLLAKLRARYRAGAAPVTVMPLELRERNAEVLRGLVSQVAELWSVGGDELEWILHGVRWRSTLVDRICPPAPSIEHPLSADPLATWVEPYALLAVEWHPGDPLVCDHPQAVHTADVAPYFLRKVRILNGLHTALVTWSAGDAELFARANTVLSAVSIASVEERLRILGAEILSVIGDRIEGGEQFLEDVIDRFKNPYFRHLLAKIAEAHEMKFDIRLRSTLTEALDKGLETPELAALADLHVANRASGAYGRYGG